MSSSQKNGDLEPDYSRKYTESTDAPFYVHDIGPLIPPQTRSLLETYSGVPSAEVLPHVRTIRDKAWSIRSYASIGLGSWLDPSPPKLPLYPQILQTLRLGGTIVDIGCFLGQDLRRLVVDGVPSKNLYGVDNVNFWDLGYEMYRDRDRFHATYIEADLFTNGEKLRGLEGAMDFINATYLLHLWNLATQVRACKKFVKMSRGVGSIIFGFQIGSLDAGERPWNDDFTSDAAFAHDPSTLARMWQQIGEETGTKWKVEADFKSWEDMGWRRQQMTFLSDEKRCLQFIVTRTQ